MVTIRLDKTIEELDRQIELAAAAYSAAHDKWRYLRSARDVLTNPLVSNLSFQVEGVSDDAAATPKANKDYGGLKRTVFLTLLEGRSKTSQDVVDEMMAGGYTFRSKNPQVSVNEALKRLEGEKRIITTGKNGSNANLWRKLAGATEPSSQEGEDTEESEEQQNEPTEAGS